MTTTEGSSRNTPANYCVYVWEFSVCVCVCVCVCVYVCVCEHGMPCALEINNSAGYERRHIEFRSSATINISLLPQCLTTKLGRVVIYHEGLPSIIPYDPLITWSYEMT